MIGGIIQAAPERLSLDQLFRLTEIAHETKDTDIRKAALHILAVALHPPITFYPGEKLEGEP